MLSLRLVRLTLAASILLAASATMPTVSSAAQNDSRVIAFTDIEAGLMAVAFGSVAWGDYDNDGDLDILLTGHTDTEAISLVYENDPENPAGTFTDIAAGLPGVWGSSVAWGDYDNDGDLDILLSGYTGLAYPNDHISRVYENDAGTFDIAAQLQGVSSCSAAWGDYDNDGDLDILLTGYTGSGYISRVYENDAGSFISQGSAGLEGVQDGSVAWGDYDNDGDLDILIAGETLYSGRISRVYENDRGTFADIEAALPGLAQSSVAWGDYDNDGDLDILLAGDTGSGYISRVHENDPGNPAGRFAHITATLPGVAQSSVTWGDYDNDGDLDILMTGFLTGTESISRVYENDGGTFTEFEAGLTGVDHGSVAWGDYDNDGDLDILLTGNTGSGYISDVYENDGAPPNTTPAPPTNLSLSVDGNVATFSWDAATDGETPAAGLTYNLRIGTTPGGDEICPSMADVASGYRRVVQLGNTDHNTTWAITLPDALPLWAYWSVQAVDGAFEGSAFAAEQSHNLIPFGDIGAGLPWVESGSAAWGDYDNDGDLDILLTGWTGSGPISRVYENDGGTFADIEAGLRGVDSGSADWGDYDNDGDLDILLTGWASRVYENDGGTFTDIEAGLEPVLASAAAWGDYDNDGDLDILLAGIHTGTESISRVYENDGGTFANIEAGLTGVDRCSVAWGDYDNDGDLDILLTGDTADSGYVSRVYENDPDNRAGRFAHIAAGLPGVNASSVAWGDYDNDGDLDILMAGEADTGSVSLIYENDGGTFTEFEAGLTGVDHGSVAWGDYDNDGDLDILLTGSSTSSGRISRVYENDAGTFTNRTAGLPGVNYSSAAWGDYDNDGDLDILMTGDAGSENYISRVYENDFDAPVNTAPAAPSNLSCAVAGGLATFSWDAATDDETPSAGLTYNLRVGTTPGGDEICSGMADGATGYRRIVQLGNAQQRTSWDIALPAAPAQYCWSVQAVDGAFAGSPFAAEQSFRSVSFAEVAAGLPGVASSSVAWGDYDNDGDLDILLTGSSTSSGRISRVYENDAGTFTDIAAGLTGVYDSSVAWGDYDNDGDLDILLTGYTLSSGYISRVYENDAGTFTDIGAGLEGVFASSAAWGDYDNDGDLDILLTGHSISSGYISRVYENDAGTFTDIAAGLTGVYDSSVAWGDYDNDGDLDILMTGDSSTGAISRVYENDVGTFTDIAAGLTGVYDSSVAWGDYDNDGDLDILMTGDPGSENYISRVYENDAGTFTDIAAGLTGVDLSSVAWGDYDNDGDLDILMSGEVETGSASRVYENDGGTFTDIEAELEGVYRSSVAWGDYDNDGDLDILLTGNTGSERISRVYENDSAPANTAPAAPSNLAFSLDENTATFSWDAATDDETPSAGLTYNLRVGTTPGGDEICSSMADSASGYRRLVQLGNANHNTTWALTLPDTLPPWAYWSVQALDTTFEGSPFAAIETILLGATGVDDPEDDAPVTALRLYPCAPNPFNPRTVIHYDLPTETPVRVVIYDAAGRYVTTLVDEPAQAPGRHEAIWDGRSAGGQSVASGIYFCRMESGDFREVRKMALVR